MNRFTAKEQDLPRLCAASLSVISLMLLPVPMALSEEATERARLEEVIVTAQKRSENVQNVPIAMQAFTAEQLQRARVSQLTDITRMAPNLNVVVQNALSQHIVIRGVGTNEFFGNAPSSVGMYMDEVTMNSSYMSTLGLFDMERIEVLRGPQNSLFGRNTTGGAINYISHQPRVGEGREGYALLTYGQHNLLEAEGGVTIPTGSQSAVRLAGIYHRRDGIWNNLDSGDDTYGDEDRYSLRATWRWEPSSKARVTASAHYARNNGQAQPQKVAGALLNNPPLRINDLAPFTANIDWTQPANVAGLVNIEGFDHHADDWHDVYTGGSKRGDLNVDGANLKIEYDYGGATLTSITAYDKT
ncbi:MAG TPA: TonB-dependent receptor, partial [Povalibacter sp.]|nr:TonB-dependent receptor [Povalibacter sp.]